MMRIKMRITTCHRCKAQSEFVDDKDLPYRWIHLD